MIEKSLHEQFGDKAEQLKIVWRSLSIERNINAGEMVEDFYQERFNDLCKIKSDAWIVVNDMVHLVEELDDFRNKLEQIKSNPQIAELWQTIETTMELVR